MHLFLQTIFDIFFPPSKEEVLVRRMTKENVLPLLRIQSIQNVITLSDFKSTYIAALIHEAKFHGNTKATLLLSALLTEYLKKQKHTDLLIIPIPLAKARYRSRGYNQVAEVVKMALRDTDTYILNERALVRTRNTQSQTGLSREERLVNVKDAFQVKRPEDIEGRNILLIDDVLTTGATLNAARAKLLQHSPASLTCIALAH